VSFIPERDGFLVADALNTRNAPERDAWHAAGRPTMVDPSRGSSETGDESPLPTGHGMAKKATNGNNGHPDAPDIESLDDLFAADVRPVHRFYSKVLKKHVYLRAISGVARDKLEELNFVEDDEGKVKPVTEGRLARTAAAHLVNARGDRICVGPEQVARLNETLSAAALQEIVIEAAKMSALSEESVEAEVKNSDAGPSSTS
jgi:hypothetical protein